WIGLGVMLTLLDSSNADWEWVAPNILLSFVLIRFAHRYVSKLVERYPWVSVALLVSILIAVLPIAAQLFDYGAEGWLWGGVGLYAAPSIAGMSTPKQLPKWAARITAPHHHLKRRNRASVYCAC